ncbi:MAG: protein kinase [Deltaproteobacteria bacterium]|nr:protein kinase [Deltaproteobacteria bacterium]
MTAPGIKPNYLIPGTVVGAYRVEEQIGGGGFGFVYRVMRDGKTYALKIGQARLSELGAEERVETLERLEREVAALMSLRHPNIVRVHSYERWPDLEGGFPYLVMDYVEGRPLQEWRERARPSLARVAAVFERIADALQHMHALGIIHRDLKSENLIVRQVDGVPFIVDFGIARPVLARNVTQASAVGTLTHLAPEYATFLDSAEGRRGAPFDWQPATDLYALGYVLYEALACEPPVPRFPERTARAESELLNAVKSVVPRRPKEIEPRIPEALDELVMQLIEKDPRKRPQSAEEVGRRLRDAREAGEALEAAAWARPLDVPGAGSEPAAGEDARPEPAVGGEEELAPLEAGDEPKAAAAGKDDKAAAPATGAWPRKEQRPPAPAPRPSPAVSVPTEGGSPAYVGGPEEAARAEERRPVEHSQVSQILRRAAAEFPTAAPGPRRWKVAGAAAAGVLVLVSVALAAVAMRDASRQPAARTLLAGTESPGSQGPPALADPPAAAPSPALTLPAAPSGPAPGADMDRSALPSTAARRARPSGDARARDEELMREPGRPADPPDGRLAETPPAEVGEPSGLLRSKPLGAEPPGLLRSVTLDRGEARKPASRGVVFGSHIQARLLTNLDTRTIGNGPVEALLHVPFIVRGKVLLPSRTMVYGTAAESGGRFTIRFTRMRLPDDTDLTFEGIALARDDGKPGLAASGRIGQEPRRGEGLGTKVARGTGNLLLDTVAGGLGQDIARGAGQAALNHEEAPPVSSEWALLLDAGVVFDVFVERAF